MFCDGVQSAIPDLMSHSLLDIDVTFEDAAPLELAERATCPPGFDLARFASESMVDGEASRPTTEISERNLSALIANSIPPTCIVGADQFGSRTPAAPLVQAWHDSRS